MRAKSLLIGTVFALCGTAADAQWVVTDPGNLAQSIINMSDNIAHTSKTAVNTAESFAETVKIYEQAKRYYDQLKAVNNLIQDARKVRDIILMVGDVSDIYVTNFGKMMNDGNFSPRELDAIAFGYARLLEEGKTPAQARRILGDTYYVSPSRRRLAVETAQAGLRAKADLRPEDISLYIGIPFCPTRCAYCSFVSQSVEKSLGLVEPYLDVLCR